LLSRWAKACAPIRGPPAFNPPQPWAPCPAPAPVGLLHGGLHGTVEALLALLHALLSLVQVGARLGEALAHVLGQVQVAGLVDDVKAVLACLAVIEEVDGRGRGVGGTGGEQRRAGGEAGEHLNGRGAGAQGQGVNGCCKCHVAESEHERVRPSSVPIQWHAETYAGAQQRRPNSQCAHSSCCQGPGPTHRAARLRRSADHHTGPAEGNVSDHKQHTGATGAVQAAHIESQASDPRPALSSPPSEDPAIHLALGRTASG
jgi:hypothetical protein